MQFFVFRLLILFKCKGIILIKKEMCFKNILPYFFEANSNDFQ